jgi:flavin-binding protein dodecin
MQAVERALGSLPDVDTDRVVDALGRDVVESVVEERGLDAATDEAVLRAAIERVTVDGALDLDELRDATAAAIGTDDW